MSNIIYILTNEAMPKYVKIGKTTDLERRMKDLDNTSTPLPFECFYACKVADMDFAEKKIHEAFSDHRVRINREFFDLSPLNAKAVLELIALEDVTPGIDIVETADDQRALDKARSKPNFKFKMLNIPIGSELTFIHDETIKAKVIDENNTIKVGDEDESTTVSAAAKKLMNTERPLQGTLYWLFEGETLNERRNRLES